MINCKKSSQPQNCKVYIFASVCNYMVDFFAILTRFCLGSSLSLLGDLGCFLVFLMLLLMRDDMGFYCVVCSVGFVLSWSSSEYRRLFFSGGECVIMYDWLICIWSVTWTHHYFKRQIRSCTLRTSRFTSISSLPPTPSELCFLVVHLHSHHSWSQYKCIQDVGKWWSEWHIWYNPLQWASYIQTVVSRIFILEYWLP